MHGAGWVDGVFLVNFSVKEAGIYFFLTGRGHSYVTYDHTVL